LSLIAVISKKTIKKWVNSFTFDKSEQSINVNTINQKWVSNSWKCCTNSLLLETTITMYYVTLCQTDLSYQLLKTVIGAIIQIMSFQWYEKVQNCCPILKWPRSHFGQNDPNSKHGWDSWIGKLLCIHLICHYDAGGNEKLLKMFNRNTQVSQNNNLMVVSVSITAAISVGPVWGSSITVWAVSVRWVLGWHKVENFWNPLQKAQFPITWVLRIPKWPIFGFWVNVLLCLQALKVLLSTLLSENGGASETPTKVT